MSGFLQSFSFLKAEHCFARSFAEGLRPELLFGDLVTQKRQCFLRMIYYGRGLIYPEWFGDEQQFVSGRLAHLSDEGSFTCRNTIHLVESQFVKCSGLRQFVFFLKSFDQLRGGGTELFVS